MQELEKILEEIEKEAMNNPEVGRKQYEGMMCAMNIIRKHMNDGNCGECSRRKWYLKGYEDGKSVGVIAKILLEMQEAKEIVLSPKGGDCFGEPCDGDDCLLCVVDKCIEIVQKYANDGWISVKWLLPEKPKENPVFDGKELELYLVDIGANYPLRAFWNGKKFTDGWSILNVKAWQPLPKRYRPERKCETE